ncbi:S8 family peptidase [Desulfosediminicola sp.]|uniref:S8 family peptidase n=1 Tax=Desulfosediminicola sp. TaxID=2886825 RepID=UPI003AF1F444
MKNLRNYVILRTSKIITPTLEHLGRWATTMGVSAEQPDDIELVQTELSLKERNDIRRDPRTRAVAMPMPIKMIAPVRIRSSAETESSTIPWGLGAVGALETPYTGKGIAVAVLDSGIDPDHPAFSGVQLTKRNFTTESDDDQNGHGTHCAGTIFGREVNGQRIGIATGVERAIIGKVLGSEGGSSATIAQAIQWAVSEGAHVISMSLGIDFPGFVAYLIERQGVNPEPATSLALEAYRSNINLFRELADYVSAQSMFSHGTVIVAASGNESHRPEYEIAVAPPAAANGIISVGALEKTDQGFKTTYFSNNQVDISGPGVDVVSAKPGGGLASMSGTSMATPHVAGVAALWAQRQLEKTGAINGQRLQARLVSCGSCKEMATGMETEDIGTGMVQAPRE